MLQTIIISSIILILAAAGLALRLFFVKNAEARGSCGGRNPMLVNEIGECTVCGSKPTESCKKDVN